MPDCGLNPACLAKKGAEKVASAPFNGAWEHLGKLVVKAETEVMKGMASFWVHVPTPNVTLAGDRTHPSDPVGFIQHSLFQWTLGLAVLAVVVGGTKMAWERRGEPGRDLLKALFTLVVVSGAGLAAVGVLLTAADAFSVWIIKQSTPGGTFLKHVTELVVLTGPGLSTLAKIVLGLLALFAGTVQVVLLVIRGGLLVLLAGILPACAAFTNTEMGRSWFRKCVSWLLAFILYKPAAAIVYATAFRLIGTQDKGMSAVVQVIIGLGLMFAALIALPALMRFVTPMVSSLASGGGGGAASGALLATGAVSVVERGLGAAGTSGGGKQKDSGSAPSPPSPAGARTAPSNATSPAGATPGGGGGAGAAGKGAGAGAGKAAAGGGAAGGAAAAAGPAGAGVMAAQKVKEGAKKAHDAAKGAVEGATGEGDGGPHGSQ